MPNLQYIYKPQEKRRKEAGKMTLKDFKQNVADKTGIPVKLLTGETEEENIAQAKAFLAYKRDCDAQRPKTSREEFAEWLSTQDGMGQPDEALTALNQIEEKMRIDRGGYPMIKDGGSVNVQIGDGRSPQEQFGEWFSEIMSFNPLKSDDGWKHLL